MKPHPWMPNSKPEVLEEMLKTIGVKTVDELYNDIPAEARFRGEWDKLPIGKGRMLSEGEVAEILEEKLSKVKIFKPVPFMGAGVYPVYTPEPVKWVLSLGEILTAYTPYQAEINQGLMQLLFEYQSLMADLLEMEVVNSSMYDWSTALGEAGLMSLRVNKGRRRILVPETMNPRHRRVLQAYVEPHGATVDEYSIDKETGYADLDSLEEKLGSNAAMVYLEYPSYTGVIDENAAHVSEAAHRHGALMVMGVEPVQMALVKPPGRLGADIAVGEGQPLGLPLGYGGPYLGIFAVRWDMKLVRNMPGRIIGLTEDTEGERAYAMILQTREQHIKRARATSNITTNEALMAVMAAAYMMYYGGDGLAELARGLYYKSHYLAKRLSSTGIAAPLLSGFYIREFTVRLPSDAVSARKKLIDKGIMAGVPIGGLTSWLGPNDMTLAVSDLHTKRDLDMLVDALVEVAGL